MKHATMRKPDLKHMPDMEIATNKCYSPLAVTAAIKLILESLPTDASSLTSVSSTFSPVYSSGGVPASPPISPPSANAGCNKPGAGDGIGEIMGGGGEGERAVYTSSDNGLAGCSSGCASEEPTNGLLGRGLEGRGPIGPGLAGCGLLRRASRGLPGGTGCVLSV